MSNPVSRRGFLQTASVTGAAALGAGATTLSAPVKAAAAEKYKYQGGISPWPLSMNTSTIRPASLQDKIKVTAEAGWDAIEPWINDLEKYEEEGGNLKDLGKQIKDMGLYVPNVIGLWNSIPENQAEWEASLEITRKRMRQCADVGSQHVASIPTPDRENFDVKWGAERYRDLLRIGREDYGIVVAIEFIGFLKGLNKFGMACSLAVDSNDPTACIIADTFHLWRGGSGFNGIQLLNEKIIANFHWNDIGADAKPEGTGDASRILPGDGVLPLHQALRDLKAIGYTRTLSLELFNEELWAKDPKEVSEVGLRKMREGVEKALA